MSKNADKKKDAKEKKGSAEKEEVAADNKDAKIEELTNDLKRVQAEFENYKKRCDKENSSFREFAKADLIRKLLTVLDSFELALKNPDDHDELVKGVELIYSQLYSLLKEEGLKHIETKDAKFDPYYHEVMLTEPSEKDDDAILEELQKGYTLKGQVLRHSKVKIAKNVDESSKSEEADD